MIMDDGTSELTTRLRLGRRLALVSVVSSSLLALGNLIIGYLAGSTSVVAAGLEFVGDVIASSVVYVGMLAASRPADNDHPYGHGRVDLLAGLLVGVTITFGGLWICYRSLQKVGEFHSPPAAYAAWPLIVAIVAKILLSVSKFRVGRRIESAALVGDAWNDAVDILSGFAALTALGLTISDPGRFLAADHYGGFAVGLIVVLTGVRIVRDASVGLMDTMPSQDLIDRIRKVAANVPGVSGVEKCRARKTGLQHHVDLHVEVDPNLTVSEGHGIASTVRWSIRREIASVADVLVHVEPTKEGVPNRSPNRS